MNQRWYRRENRRTSTSTSMTLKSTKNLQSLLTPFTIWLRITWLRLFISLVTLNHPFLLPPMVLWEWPLIWPIELMPTKVWSTEWNKLEKFRTQSSLFGVLVILLSFNSMDSKMSTSKEVSWITCQLQALTTSILQSTNCILKSKSKDSPELEGQSSLLITHTSTCLGMTSTWCLTTWTLSLSSTPRRRAFAKSLEWIGCRGTLDAISLRLVRRSETKSPPIFSRWDLVTLAKVSRWR